MIKDLFSLREEEIFKTLRDLKDCEFVVIGSYAVNAYALPRFSVDCDMFIKNIKNSRDLNKIEKILFKRGYKKEVLETKEALKADTPYSGCFLRYGKQLDNNFSVSIDLLIGSVSDRMTDVKFEAEWIFENSEIKVLNGKTIAEELRLRIINIDALLVMKIVSCRATDIRDVFMMLPNAKDKVWLKAEVSLRYNFENRMAKIIDKVQSKQFQDGLAGVYGGIDAKIFAKHLKTVLALGES